MKKVWLLVYCGGAGTSAAVLLWLSPSVVMGLWLVFHCGVAVGVVCSWGDCE